MQMKTIFIILQLMFVFVIIDIKFDYLFKLYKMVFKRLKETNFVISVLIYTVKQTIRMKLLNNGKHFVNYTEVKRSP